MSSATDKDAPLGGNAPDNHGGDVIVFVACALLFSVLFTIVRFGTVARKRLGFGVDDAFFLLSLTLALAQGVTVGLAVHNGLGQHTSAMSAASLTNFYKDIYTDRILSVLSMGCAKMSVTYLYRRLEIYPMWKFNYFPAVMVVAWTVFSLFATAFQCHLPAPWQFSSSHCPAGPGLTITVAALNCITDIVLAVYPIPALIAVSISLAARLTTIALFSTRILVCVMAIIDVTYAVHTFSASDPTWDTFTPVITGVVLINLSLMIATVPRLHSYLATIPSGLTSTRLPSFAVPDSSKGNRSPPRVESAGNGATQGTGGSSPRMLKVAPDEYTVVLTTQVSGRPGQGSQERLADGPAIEKVPKHDDAMASRSSSESESTHKASSARYAAKRKQ